MMPRLTLTLQFPAAKAYPSHKAILPRATARHHPPLAPVIFTGKHATWKPRGGSSPRFASFSIWKYSWSMPTRCASHSSDASPVSWNSRAT